MNTKSPQIKITFPNILIAIFPFIVFYILKLIGAVDWDWVTVTSPLWIYICWCLGFLILGIFSALYILILRRVNSLKS